MATRKLIPELEAHLAALSDRLGLESRIKEPISAYIAGGVAVNYWTGYRMSDDVDIKWSHRVAIPQTCRPSRSRTRMTRWTGA